MGFIHDQDGGIQSEFEEAGWEVTATKYYVVGMIPEVEGEVHIAGERTARMADIISIQSSAYSSSSLFIPSASPS